MGRRGGKNRRAQQSNAADFRCMGRSHGLYWQSDDLNERVYWYYVNMISQMALERFRWLNLPATCDERYLEWCLLYEGIATIAFPRKMRGTFYSTKAVTAGPINLYDIPTKWRSFGNNGWTFFCDNSNGVLVYDNVSRYPLIEGINIYAHELTHIRIAKRMNRNHQKIPFILTGPQEKYQDMVNIYKQVDGGEMAVIATDGYSAINIDAIKTDVPFIGEALDQDEVNVWNRIYNMLGIENAPYKQERQTEDEIRAQKSPSTLVRMASLEERRKAANKLNERFGQYLEAPIQVVFRQDNESENWNFRHNIQSQVRADK